jgi:hypothetical protein
MTRFIGRESLTVLRPLPSSTAGDLARVPIPVATIEDLIVVDRGKLPPRAPAVPPCNNRALRPLLLSRPDPSRRDKLLLLGVRRSKGYRVPRRLGAVLLATKHGSSAAEVMKVCRVREPRAPRPEPQEAPPAAEVKAAHHAAVEIPAPHRAVDMASEYCVLTTLIRYGG